MRAGKLNRRATIQQLVAGSPSQNTSGEPEEAWTDYKTFWANIRPLKGRELISAQQISSDVEGEIRLRYSTASSAITTKMRASYGGKIYNLIAIVNVEERNVELILYYRQGASDG